MRGLGATGRFGGAVVRNAVIVAMAAGLFTGAVGFASADDPVAPATESVAPTAAPPLPAVTVPAAEPAPAAPVSPVPSATTDVPVTTVPPTQPAPVTTVPPAPSAPVTTPPIPLTPVPAVEAPPAAPVLPPLTADPAPSAPQTPIPVTALFTLTTMPNAWMSTPNIRPALEIQSDGRAVKRQDGKELNGTVPADVLAAAATEVRALALSDMGSPTVSDQGNMIIDFMPKSPDQDVHVIVYAPEFSEGLTDEQKASRKRFTDLYQRLLNAFVTS